MPVRRLPSNPNLDHLSNSKVTTAENGGVNPETETLVKAHLAERTASGKETSGTFDCEQNLCT
jgi:hypothetical protein